MIRVNFRSAAGVYPLAQLPVILRNRTGEMYTRWAREYWGTTAKALLYVHNYEYNVRDHGTPYE